MSKWHKVDRYIFNLDAITSIELYSSTGGTVRCGSDERELSKADMDKLLEVIGQGEWKDDEKGL